MNKYSNILMGFGLSAALVCTTGCRDDFADINSSPSQVTVGDPSYLFAMAAMDFEPFGYTFWFYDAPMLTSWSQMAVPTGSFTESSALTTVTGGVSYVNTLKLAHEITYLRSNMSEEDAAKHAVTAACVDVLTTYLALSSSDINGDIQFTEAGNALHGGTLTPAYDRIADLYTLWLDQLNSAITTFTTATDQIFTNEQDIVYKGDRAKWAKMANSLKLRIAARLISQDKARALTIASEVANASCGYIDSLDDAMLFNKSVVNSSSDDYI